MSHTINNPCLAATNNPSSRAGTVGAAPVKVAPHWFIVNPKGDSLPVRSYFLWSALLFSFSCVFKCILQLGKISRSEEKDEDRRKINSVAAGREEEQPGL